MRLIFTIIAAAAVGCASAGVFSLDSCRELALANNKQLAISRQRIHTADYAKREAFAAYLPSFDFEGGYAYNQKNVSIFGTDQLLPTKTFDPKTGGYEFNLVRNPETGAPIVDPKTGMPVPETVALIPKEAMTFDIHNVFFGAVTLTQPIFMGGKIVAMNKLTGYAHDMAVAMHNAEIENVVYAVDAAYWMVVSLNAKERLATSYVNLLDSLDQNVAAMLEQGVATRAEKLQVDVKLNSARVDLTKVQNGLTLSRMALAQICGLPINADMHVADEDNADAVRLASLGDDSFAVTADVLNNAYEQRPDLAALNSGVQMAGAAKRVAMSTMLPNLALVGAYSFTNPNSFDGFKKKFGGAFSVGAVLRIPLWHWGGNYYKYKAAESEETLMRYRLEDARTLVDLQINQAAFKAREAVKTLRTTYDNLASAEENLRCATVGFREGVITSDDVMAAQTAWLKANSENIDAGIDVRLCNVYLQKVLGTLK